MKYLTSERLNEALAVAANRSQRDYIVIYILSNTGIRASELISMTPNDLQDTDELIVRGKGNKIRNIDISPTFKMVLRNYIKNHNIKNKERIIKISRQRIYQLTQEIAQCNPHMFRHSYAIHLLRATKNIRYVQLQLGHSTILTTQVYLRYMDFDEEKQKLHELF